MRHHGWHRAVGENGSENVVDIRVVSQSKIFRTTPLLTCTFGTLNRTALSRP